MGSEKNAEPETLIEKPTSLTPPTQTHTHTLNVSIVNAAEGPLL